MVALLGLPVLAEAQEVLFLRIRPQAEDVASGGGFARAFAGRQAAWERSNARARTIIESVCTGCLAPWSSPAPKPVAVAALPEIPAVRGLESDPPSGASEPTSDPSSRE